jgi:hypothetical protein
MNPTIESARAESRETAYITKYSVRGVFHLERRSVLVRRYALKGGTESGGMLSSGSFNFERMLSFRLTTQKGGEETSKQAIASVFSSYTRVFLRRTGYCLSRGRAGPFLERLG